MPFPVTIVSSGGLAISEATSGTPMTPVVSGGVPVTIVSSGGYPATLVYNDFSSYRGFLTGAAVHLNFASGTYYWGGAAKVAGDFTSFTGGTLSPGIGLVLDGTATNHNVNISLATLGISPPFAMIVNFIPASVTGTQNIAVADLDATNFVTIGLNATFYLSFVSTAGVTQASQNNGTAAIGTRGTLGANFKTNNILQSVNGSTGATADTSATLPAVTTLRIGERTIDTAGFNGTIRHVVVFSGAKTQTELNSLTAQVHAL